MLYPGGKGANQALAAARAGARVHLYGAVGRDTFAADALALLTREGVDLRGVARVDAATGCASIHVDENGDNCIVAVAGANACADPAAVPDEVLGSNTLVMLQHELPDAANAAVLTRSRARGARIVLNASPAREVSGERLRLLDTLIVNADEADALATAHGWPAGPRALAAAAARSLPGVAIVVTLGADGVIAARDDDAWQVAAPVVHVVDTTGAGDVFAGTLAAAYDAGRNLPDALRLAVAAGSLACTSPGAQAGAPDGDAIRRLAAGLETRRQ